MTLSYGHQMVYIYTKDTQGPTLCGKNYISFYIESMLPEIMTHRLQRASSEDVTMCSAGPR